MVFFHCLHNRFERSGVRCNLKNTIDFCEGARLFHDTARVLEFLAGGHRLQFGGGRWYPVYYLEAGELRREIFDEGRVADEAANEAVPAFA